MSETRDIRLKRIRIRCWRRGTKEMDLLFGRYADEALTALTDDDLDAFEALMDENDNDLYLWISAAEAAPEQHTGALRRVQEFHNIRG